MVRVSLFVTCVVDQVFPNVGMAMTEVLERAGCEVEFREAQTCCAQPAFNSGYRDQARTGLRCQIVVSAAPVSGAERLRNC